VEADGVHSVLPELRFRGPDLDRLTTPLRRRPDGTHEAVSWETALKEIAGRPRARHAAHGGEAYAPNAEDRNVITAFATVKA